MLYSFQAGVLFVHVSRTAGISIQTCLRTGLTESAPLGSSQHAPLCEARSELGELFASTYKFAIVRNPWDRLVSWYSHISSVSNVSDLSSEAFADPDAAHWKGFDEYLDMALNQPCTINGKERRALSQFHQLADAEGKLLTDGLGRFEHLATDLSRLLKEANLRCPPLKKLNQSSHLHYSVYYSNYGRQLVNELMKEDIDHFDYRFDPVVHS